MHAQITALGNDGVRLAQSADRAGAEERLRRALALAEQHLGADDPVTVVCLSNLGDFLGQDPQRTDEAEALLRRAVAAEERLHGPDALETAWALNNLALVLRRTRRLPEAASVMNNLAQILQHSGRSALAEPLMRRVIELFERQRGQNHPDVAVALNNLARLLEDTGRAAEAEPLSRRHLRIFQEHENETGRPHRHKRAAIATYGDLLLGLGLDRRRAQQRIDDLLLGREVRDLRDSAAVDEPTAEHAVSAEAVDFDRLSAFADDAGASIADQNALFGAAFRLNEWYFIARGTLPDVRPYVASNPTIAGGAPMVKAFTDTQRLHAYARENALTGPEGDVQILALPVHTILFTTTDLESQGVTHIHFNGDAASHGFYIPLAQLPLVERHLKRLGLVPG